MQTLKAQDLTRLFANKTGCNCQELGCPCNTCFHSIEHVDFRHICWLIVLGLRGDYDRKEIIPAIEEELRCRRL